MVAACFAVSVWLPSQLTPVQDDYQLNLLARLDDPDQQTHHQAENEHELLKWRQSQ